MKALAALLLFAATILAADVPERSQPQPKPMLEDHRDLTGYYHFSGVVKGDVYEGMVRVIGLPTGPTYKVIWLSDDGDKTEGVGFDDGSTLSVGWSAVIGQGPSGVNIKNGVNVYRVESEGKLKGRWTVGGSVFREDWNFLKR